MTDDDNDDLYTEAAHMNAVATAVMDLMIKDGLTSEQGLKVLCILLGTAIRVWGIDKPKIKEKVFKFIGSVIRGDYDA